MKRLLPILFVLLMAGASYAADVTGSVTSLPSTGSLFSAMKFSNGASFGFINESGTSAAVFRWKPDFNYSGLGVGLDINIPMNTKDQVSMNNVVIRYVKYDSPIWGLYYGILSNMTYGNGLVLNNYSSNAQGSIIQTGQQNGLSGYVNYGIYGVQYFATISKVYGVNLTQQVLPGLTLGEYIVSDHDGITFIKPDGTTVNYPSQTGYGVYGLYPLGYGARLFAEGAHMSNHGSGFTGGFAWDFSVLDLGNASFKAEKRYIDNNFVPGYFNVDYEINPIDFASYEATSTKKDGYAVTLAANILGKGDLWANLESYNNSQASFKAIANANVDDKTFVSATYMQPNFTDFRSLDYSQGAYLTGRIGYKVNPFTTVIVNFKKSYDASLGKVVETQWYEMGFAF